MYKFKNLTEQLEAVELNILDALQLIKSTVQSFEFIRNDSEQMTSMIESGMSFAQKIGIDVEGDFKKHHRNVVHLKDLMPTLRMPPHWI